MKKLLVFIFIITIKLNAQSYPATNGEWTLNSNKSDEFNNGFDSQKWEKGIWFSCKKEVAFKNENVYVTNDKLIITAKEEKNLGQCNGHEIKYTAGSLKSKFTIGDNSFIEVRAKTLNHLSDMTSAIWLSDKPIKENIPNVEIDLIETLFAKTHPNQVGSAIHMWLPDEYVGFASPHPYSFQHDNPENLDENFHTYGLERDGNTLRFYINGTLYHSKNIWDDTHFDNIDFPYGYRPSLTQQQRPIIISLEGHDGDHSINNFPQNFEIDYVRVYTKNAPCPIDKVISTSVNSNAYHQASNLITASSNISSNLTVTLRANQVILKPGFKVSGNSTGIFRAYLDPCQSNTTKSDSQTLFNKEENENIPILFPNPVETLLTINNIENLKEWSIVDINGKIVNTGKTNLKQNKITINTSKLIPGIYYFNGLMKEGKLIQKAIIKK